MLRFGSPRFLALLIAGSIVVSLPAAARSGKDTIKIPVTQARALAIEPVKTLRFQPQKQAIGQLAFNEDTSTIVVAPFAGRVTKVLGKVGDSVSVGTPLFEIDSPEVVQMQTDLIAALNSAEKARAQLSLAKRVLDRQTTLVAEKAAAMRELDQARADYSAAESDLRTAEGAVSAARNKVRVLVGRSDADVARIERERVIDPLVVVRSPINGEIVARKIGPGQLVRPDTGDTLFSIADLSTMWLRAAVPENDIPAVRVGQELEVRIEAMPRTAFKAKINAIGAASDSSTRRVMVRSEIANPDRLLRPEMFATFKIFTGEGETLPAIPVASIIREADAAFVYVEVKPQEFERRPIELGVQQDEQVAVLQGLSVGDKVVTRGAIFIDNEWKQ